MNDANDGTKNIMMVLKAIAAQDHPKLRSAPPSPPPPYPPLVLLLTPFSRLPRSLYWHTVIFFAYHLVSILDVLSYKKPVSKA
jgi:hypothetical protein